jgi:hypothetical protein
MMFRQNRVFLNCQIIIVLFGSILSNLEKCMFFLDPEGFLAETGSLAPLRGSKRPIILYQIYVVHFIARSGRMQPDRSKTLV